MPGAFYAMRFAAVVKCCPFTRGHQPPPLTRSTYYDRIRAGRGGDTAEPFTLPCAANKRGWIVF